MFLEVVLRFFISPSQKSFGIFLDRELPPIKVIPSASSPKDDRSQQYKDLITKEQKISIDDLYGTLREDSLLGYTPQENSISSSGWWQDRKSVV